MNRSYNIVLFSPGSTRGLTKTAIFRILKLADKVTRSGLVIKARLKDAVTHLVQLSTNEGSIISVCEIN